MLRIASNISVTGIINAFGKHVVKSTKKEKKKKIQRKKSTKIKGDGANRAEQSKQEPRTKNKTKGRTLLPNERQTPRKHVHKVRQSIRVCRRIVLPNHDILVSKSEF